MNNPLIELLMAIMEEYPIGSFCYHKANTERGVVNAYRISHDDNISIEVDFGDMCQVFPLHSLTNKDEDWKASQEMK